MGKSQRARNIIVRILSNPRLGLPIPPPSPSPPDSPIWELKNLTSRESRPGSAHERASRAPEIATETRATRPFGQLRHSYEDCKETKTHRKNCVSSTAFMIVAPKNDAMFDLKATDSGACLLLRCIFIIAAPLVQKEFISLIYTKIPMLLTVLCVGF